MPDFFNGAEQDVGGGGGGGGLSLVQIRRGIFADLSVPEANWPDPQNWYRQGVGIDGEGRELIAYRLPVITTVDATGDWAIVAPNTSLRFSGVTRVYRGRAPSTNPYNNPSEWDFYWEFDTDLWKSYELDHDNQGWTTIADGTEFAGVDGRTYRWRTANTLATITNPLADDVYYDTGKTQLIRLTSPNTSRGVNPNIVFGTAWLNYFADQAAADADTDRENGSYAVYADALYQYKIPLAWLTKEGATFFEIYLGQFDTQALAVADTQAQNGGVAVFPDSGGFDQVYQLSNFVASSQSTGYTYHWQYLSEFTHLIGPSASWPDSERFYGGLGITDDGGIRTVDKTENIIQYEVPTQPSGSFAVALQENQTVTHGGITSRYRGIDTAFPDNPSLNDFFLKQDTFLWERYHEAPPRQGTWTEIADGATFIIAPTATTPQTTLRYRSSATYSTIATPAVDDVFWDIDNDGFYRVTNITPLTVVPISGTVLVRSRWLGQFDSADDALNDINARNFAYAVYNDLLYRLGDFIESPSAKWRRVFEGEVFTGNDGVQREYLGEHAGLGGVLAYWVDSNQLPTDTDRFFYWNGTLTQFESVRRVNTPASGTLTAVAVDAQFTYNTVTYRYKGSYNSTGSGIPNPAMNDFWWNPTAESFYFYEDAGLNARSADPSLFFGDEWIGYFDTNQEAFDHANAEDNRAVIVDDVLYRLSGHTDATTDIRVNQEGTNPATFLGDNMYLGLDTETQPITLTEADEEKFAITMGVLAEFLTVDYGFHWEEVEASEIFANQWLDLYVNEADALRDNRAVDGAWAAFRASDGSYSDISVLSSYVAPGTQTLSRTEYVYAWTNPENSTTQPATGGGSGEANVWGVKAILQGQPTTDSIGFDTAGDSGIFAINDASFLSAINAGGAIVRITRSSSTLTPLGFDVLKHYIDGLIVDIGEGVTSRKFRWDGSEWQRLYDRKLESFQWQWRHGNPFTREAALLPPANASSLLQISNAPQVSYFTDDVNNIDNALAFTEDEIAGAAFTTATTIASGVYVEHKVGDVFGIYGKVRAHRTSQSNPRWGIAVFAKAEGMPTGNGNRDQLNGGILTVFRWHVNANNGDVTFRYPQAGSNWRNGGSGYEWSATQAFPRGQDKTPFGIEYLVMYNGDSADLIVRYTAQNGTAVHVQALTNVDLSDRVGGGNYFGISSIADDTQFLASQFVIDDPDALKGAFGMGV